jgi:hypothetical protein
MDWITLIIEAAGLIILAIFILIPIHEFRLIHRRLTHQTPDPKPPGADLDT